MASASRSKTAAVAQRQQDIAARRQRAQQVRVAAAHQLDQELDAVLAHQPLHRMVVHDMADLVRHHAGHLRAVLGLLYKLEIEDQDAARQGEGIDRAAFHRVHGDLVRIVGRLGEPVGEIVQRLRPASPWHSSLSAVSSSNTLSPSLTCRL